MFPYISVGNNVFNMTGVGILVSILIFALVVLYLTRKYKQNYFKFFYRLPILLVIVYLFGSYMDFLLTGQKIIPLNLEELKLLLSPYGYRLHFVGILIGFLLSVIIFMKGINRYENKKIWIDNLFISFSLSVVVLGVFLVLGDVVVGKSTTTIFGIKSLLPESSLNKYGYVYPVGFFISVGSILSLLFMLFLKKKRKDFGYGIWGFIIFLIILNFIFFFQKYPKYGVYPIANVVFDIKNFVSIVVILYLIGIHNKWKRM